MWTFILLPGKLPAARWPTGMKLSCSAFGHGWTRIKYARAVMSQLQKEV